jgi:hypothetical protein
MGTVCSANGEDCVDDFGGKARRKESTRRTLIWVEAQYRTNLREIGRKGMDWTDLVQYRNQWSAFVNMVMSECRLFGCGALWVLLEPTFWRNMSPPSSGWKESLS